MPAPSSDTRASSMVVLLRALSLSALVLLLVGIPPVGRAESDGRVPIELHRLEFGPDGSMQPGELLSGGPPGTLFALVGAAGEEASDVVTLRIADWTMALLVTTDRIVVGIIPFLPAGDYLAEVSVAGTPAGVVAIRIDELDLTHRVSVDEVGNAAEGLVGRGACSGEQCGTLGALRGRLASAAAPGHEEDLAILEAMLANIGVLNWLGLPAAAPLASFLVAPDPGCSPHKGLVPGTAGPCDDGDPCTRDSCAGGQCTHDPIRNCCAGNSRCDDGNPCTTDSCVYGRCRHDPLPNCCTSDEGCDDGNPCTTDSCIAGQCHHDPVAGCCTTDAQCDDGNPCTEDYCGAGQCRHDPIANCCTSDEGCDDGDPCTADYCMNGQCHHDPSQGTTEVCDGVDNDCDGQTDEEGADGCSLYYRDVDHDGYGDTAYVGKCLCEPEDSYTATEWDDCDDTDCSVHPGAHEICDGEDNDCDGQADEEGADGCSVYYRDVDHDGYGDAAYAGKCLCEPVGSYTAAQWDDCDDTDCDVHPGADEICDGKDNNCDGQVDEERASGCTTYYRDVDHDGYGDIAYMGKCLCEPVGSYTATEWDDCDDTDCNIHPGADEVCDGKDSDCDGQVDEGCG